GMRISFAENPDQVWEFKGVQVVPRVVDYNADGRSDLVVSVVAFTMGNVISSLLRSSIKYQIRFYPARNGTLPRRPAMVRESILDGKIYGALDREPLLGFGDVTGDGLGDFILGMENTIFCFRGDRQGRFQFGAYDGINKTLPEDARLRVFDADADHRDDLCIKEYTRNSSTLHFYLAR
ncbi:MAG: VCBS repeat-containing protein, partial [Chlorobi bacterium]|nr:VCBS repeat-containing protein [Chlorobiota bacterium]